MGVQPPENHPPPLLLPCRPNQKPLPMRVDVSSEPCGPHCYKSESGAVVVPLAHPAMQHVPAAPDVGQPKRKGRRLARTFPRGKRVRIENAGQRDSKCAHGEGGEEERLGFGCEKSSLS